MRVEMCASVDSCDVVWLQANYSWKVGMRALFLDSKLNLLSVVIPFAIFGQLMHLSDGIVFTCAIIGLVSMHSEW